MEHLAITNEKGLIILEDDLGACDICPKEDDFVLVKFGTAKNNLFYVEKVLCINSVKEEVTISFLQNKGDIFKMPNSPYIVLSLKWMLNYCYLGQLFLEKVQSCIAITNLRLCLIIPVFAKYYFYCQYTIC